MARLTRLAFRLAVLAAVLASASCKPKSVGQAEADRNVAWLADNGTPEAMAALGRLADADPHALAALEARASHDVNTYIAAWIAMTRNASWGATFLEAALADPTRADLAASALPRRDPRVAPLASDLEGAVVRLAAGQRGGVVAGVLASIGPQAHASVERRLLDPKTRGAMCDGIGVPDASGDAKSLVLAVAPEARDHASCVDAILQMADKEDVVLGWLATTAEPGLLTQAAKSVLPCARVATVWQRGLTERPPETHAALAVPLQLSIRRCATILDPVLSDLLEKAPGSRACVVNAIEPFGSELSDMKQTCNALRRSFMRAEAPRVRDRVSDALANGCKFAR